MGVVTIVVIIAVELCAVRAASSPRMHNSDEEMVRRILLALDDSDECGRALPLTRELARGSAASVVVLHVREKQVCCCGEPWETPMSCSPDQLVEYAVKSLRSAGVEAQAEILNSAGRAAESILDAAEYFEADLLVAGWQRKHTLGGLLEKSVSQKLSERSKRPLLLVP